MKLSELSLRKFVNPAISTQQLSHQLTMAGLEVDGITPVAGKFDQVVVGRIVEAVRHPDADRLRVCQVDVNGPELLSIVCGAPNARADIKVCVAMIGATLPGDFKIQKAKLRGVTSMGMLCSAKELGLNAESDGIIELPADAPVGQDLRQYLNLDDNVFEVSLTPNRADCLSLLGLAREIAAINQLSVQYPVIQATAAAIHDSLKVHLQATDACPRYVGRIIKGIRPDAKTPEWLSQSLNRAGMRSIHPVVDITNYVMLALGQPMHAFDLAKLSGDITVRYAREGEKLSLLDGNEISLKPEHLVIADASKALALAGVMGGEHSAVSESSIEIFLESAHFAPLAIAGKARNLGLHTDSSHRFERGVDPELPALAMDYASQLIIDICGGQAGPVVMAEDSAYLPKTMSIDFDPAQVEKIIGLIIAKDKVMEILKSLGFMLSPKGERLLVSVPSYRFDISIEEDLVEEVARLYGYDHLPSILPKATLAPHVPAERRIPVQRFKDVLVARAYREAITYSFIDPKLHDKLFPGVVPYALANPISSDLAVMRSSLMPGLLQALLHNIQRQQTRVRLFETGRVFIKADNAPVTEINRIGLLAYGTTFAEHWDTRAKMDFYDLKGDVEALLSVTGQALSFKPAADVGILHPGQAAYIEMAGQSVGFMGVLHPSLSQALDIRGAVFVAEIDLEAISEAQLPVFTAVSKFPSIRRDLALVVDKHIAAASLCNTVKATAGELLHDLLVFDRYEGEGMAPGKKSLGLALTLQHQERTLTDEDVANVVKNVMQALQTHHQAQLRE